VINIRDLFEEDLLAVPEEDLRLSLHQLSNGSRFATAGGVYTFYNEYNEPLYVGISVNLGRRVPEHLYSNKGNRDLRRHFKAGGEGYVSVFYEDNKMYQEFYESYLIAVLSPRYNVAKTGRRKIIT